MMPKVAALAQATTTSVFVWCAEEVSVVCGREEPVGLYGVGGKL
jgi:hypothetical protein